jgi:hypothetical protein
MYILDLHGDVTLFKKNTKEALISGEILIAVNGQVQRAAAVDAR